MSKIPLLRDCYKEIQGYKYVHERSKYKNRKPVINIINLHTECVLFCLNNTFALLTLLFLYVSNGHAEATNLHNHLQNLSSRSRTQAQRFATRLNLSYGDHDAKFLHLLDNDSAEIMVENQVRFPSLSSNSGTHFGQYAGYFKVPNTTGQAGMFYFFFEARQNKTTAPVVLWLTGGPGCSGSMALFYENGPFKVLTNLSLVWNRYGWDKVSNIIYVDQPIGTGFSYYTNKTDIPTTSEEAAAHLYEFLQAFFVKHPELAKNAFYIAGQSYAGHHIPALAAQINSENKKKQRFHINLQGIAIGNGWTNPGVEAATYPDYALNMKPINETQYYNLQTPANICQKEVNNVCVDGNHFNYTACAEAYMDCNDILYDITDLHPGINYYDIRQNCTTSVCDDFSKMEHFLNQLKVKRALGVHKRMKFVSCSHTVYVANAGDEMRNLAVYIPQLLEDGIKLLLYAGEYDLICNWLGTSKWVHEMKWSGLKGFNTSAYKPFMVDGVKAGSQKSFGKFTFLKVHNAGHMVAMDQPKAALEMLKKWMNSSALI